MYQDVVEIPSALFQDVMESIDRAMHFQCDEGYPFHIRDSASPFNLPSRNKYVSGLFGLRHESRSFNGFRRFEMLCFNVALLYFFVFFKPATAVQITNTEFNGIQTGSPFTITWTDNAGPVTILLRMGNSTDLTQLDAKAIWGGLRRSIFETEVVMLI
jgi:hypothetical protein